MASFIKPKNVGTRRRQHFVPRPSYVVVNLHRFFIFGCKGTDISNNNKDKTHFFMLKNQETHKSSANSTCDVSRLSMLSLLFNTLKATLAAKACKNEARYLYKQLQ